MFKICNKCQKQWKTRNDFLYDISLTIVGYDSNFDNINLGFFLFKHQCDQVLSIGVNEFRDLYNGKIFNEIKINKTECPGYCLNIDSLDSCNVKCAYVYERNIIQIIKNIKT